MSGRVVLQQQQQVGQIQLIFGPMFSGKSTELLRRIKRYTIANRKCLVVKYRADTRYSVDNMSTHDKQMWSAKPAEKLEEVAEAALTADVIGIDEGQFVIIQFSPIFYSSPILSNIAKNGPKKEKL